MKQPRLYAFPIAIIVAVLLALGVAAGGSGLLKKVNTVTTYAGALAIYDAALTTADVYVTNCAEGVLPPTCKPTAKTVAADVALTKNAYLASKPYGINPPTNVAAALIGAVNVLNAALPAPVPVPANY